MKLLIDIDESAYLAIKNGEALYAIGHDKYDTIVTNAFKNSMPYEEKSQGKWIFQRIDPQKSGNIHSCNLCGQEVHSYSTDYQNRPCSFNFCPRCGSEMIASQMRSVVKGRNQNV